MIRKSIKLDDFRKTWYNNRENPKPKGENQHGNQLIPIDMEALSEYDLSPHIDRDPYGTDVVDPKTDQRQRAVFRERRAVE